MLSLQRTEIPLWIQGRPQALTKSNRQNPASIRFSQNLPLRPGFYPVGLITRLDLISCKSAFRTEPLAPRKHWELDCFQLAFQFN